MDQALGDLVTVGPVLEPVTVASVLVPVSVSSSQLPFVKVSPYLDQHESPRKHHLLISHARRSSMFPLILIICPLALAATFTPRQDLPEGAITLAVFQENTSSETYVIPRGSLMIGR